MNGLVWPVPQMFQSNKQQINKTTIATATAAAIIEIIIFAPYSTHLYLNALWFICPLSKSIRFFFSLSHMTLARLNKLLYILWVWHIGRCVLSTRFYCICTLWAAQWMCVCSCRTQCIWQSHTECFNHDSVFISWLFTFVTLSSLSSPSLFYSSIFVVVIAVFMIN